jgi:hypothetical protein
VAHSGKEWSPKGIHVWVLLYEHRHGDDLLVFGSEDKALEAAVDILLEDVDEDIKAEVEALAKVGDLRKAFSIWQEWQLDHGIPETIDIVHRVVR